MNKNVLNTETPQDQQALEKESSAVPKAPAEVVPLRQVIDQVRRDSRNNPQEYLDQVMVPWGGE